MNTMDNESQKAVAVAGSGDLRLADGMGPLKVKDVMDQVKLIQEVMKAAMKDGEHYGKIPGCGDKPALLQPGAQKLILTFRMNPDYEVDVISLPHEHREYRVKCILKNNAGAFVGAGLGSCSTMEGKYRYRTTMEVTDRSVPSEYWDLRKENPKQAQELLGGPGHGVKKTDSGAWVISIKGEKEEHDNPADYWNTCLKMAKKRALVDATLTRTAASDIFTQDIEDMGASLVGGHSGTSAPAPVIDGKTGEVDTPQAEPKKPGELLASTSYEGTWPPDNPNGYAIRVVQPDSEKMAWAAKIPSESQRKKMFAEMTKRGYHSEEDQKALLIALYKDYAVEKEDCWTFSKFNVGHASWFIDALLYVPNKEKDDPPPWKVKAAGRPPAGTKPVVAKEPVQEKAHASKPAPPSDPERAEPQWEHDIPHEEQEFLEPEDAGYEEAGNGETNGDSTGGTDAPDQPADPTDEVDKDFLK